MSRILVSGSIAYDRIMDYDSIFPEPFSPDKQKHLIEHFPADSIRETFGGNAANIAYSLALLGEEPEIISVAGNDFEKYRTWMEKNRINTASIQIAPDLPTATAFIVTDKRDNQVVNFQEGAFGLCYEKPLDAQAALALLSTSQMDDMVSLPKQCTELGIPYYFDPGQRTPRLDADDLRTIISGAAALFVNEYEFRVVCEKTGWDEAQLLEHVPTLIATHAEQGSRIVTRDEEIQIRAVSATAVDPTGAGDAHRAGFLKGVVAGLPLKQCGQLASTVAAYAVEKEGTQNHSFTLEELKARYAAAYGEQLAL